MFNKKYPFIEQFDTTDCGVASVATIAKYYGLNVSIAKLREISGTDKNGNNTISLVYALEKLGFDSEGLKLSDDESIFEFDKYPAIFHIIKDESILHYVVVYSITKNLIIYADPAEGIVKSTPEEFFAVWTKVVITVKPGEDFIKGDMVPNFLLKFFTLIKSQRKLLITIFIASLLYSGLSIAGAYFFKILIDLVLPKDNFKILSYLSLGFIMLNLLKLFLNIYRSKLLLYFSKNLDMEIIMSYYCRIMYLPINFFETRKTDEVNSRFGDEFLVREAISGVTLSLMVDILMVIFGVIILINQNIVLFSIVFSTAILNTLLVYGFVKPVEKLNRYEKQQKSKLESVIVESVSGIETIKANNRQDIFIDEVKHKLNDFMDSFFRSTNLAITQKSLISFVNVTGIIVVLWVGAYYIIEGKMTLGQLFTFCALAIYFFDPISNLIKLKLKIKNAIVAADRIGEIVDLKLEKESTDTNSRLDGDINIENVGFRYGMRKKVLEDININIKKGEKVAIVGECGSGKTTLAKLILSFYAPQEGSIKINGYNIKDISYKHLRDKIAYVSQEIFLFSKTIRENLIFGKHISEANFKRIVNLTKCDEFVERLPLKYDTILAENGSTISDGQRQRIAIARALIGNPDILVLDEATSSLDTKTESAIINTLFNVLKDKTAIVIAHRLNTISRCDKIIVLDNGRVVEIGAHDELIKIRGRYFEMWDLLDKE